MTSRADQGQENLALSREIEALSTRWAEIVAGVAARYGLDGFEGDDLMQRVRVRLWRALERRGADDRPLGSGYAHAAATSAAIDIARERRARRATMHSSIEASPSIAGSAGPGADQADLIAALNLALAGLDPPRRVAVRLHLSGRHLRDIAALSGWTEAKARNLLYRGLGDLRRALEEGN